MPPPLLWHLKGVTLAQPLSTPSLILAKYSASVHKPLRLAHGLSTLGCRGSASKSRSQDPPPWALGGEAQRDPLLGLEAASGVPSRGLDRGGPGCPPHAHTDPQPHGVRGLAASVCSQAEGSGSEPGEGASLRGRLWNKSSRQPAQEPGAHGQSRALGLCSAERSGLRPHEQAGRLGRGPLEGARPVSGEGWGDRPEAGGDDDNLRAWRWEQAGVTPKPSPTPPTAALTARELGWREAWASPAWTSCPGSPPCLPVGSKPLPVPQGHLTCAWRIPGAWGHGNDASQPHAQV